MQVWSATPGRSLVRVYFPFGFCILRFEESNFHLGWGSKTPFDLRCFLSKQAVVAVADELKTENFHDIERINKRRDNVLRLWNYLLELLKSRRERMELSLALQHTFQVSPPQSSRCCIFSIVVRVKSSVPLKLQKLYARLCPGQ